MRSGQAGAAQTIELPPLAIRAGLASIDEADRAVDVVFSTGAPVERYDWSRDMRYLEALEISSSAIRVVRLQTAPLLDAHSAWSITDQIGTVVPNSFRIEGGKAIVRVRFSRRPEVNGIWQDVRDGIIQNVSVGYRIHKFEEDAGEDNAIPVRTATDWEPYEISMVPMPADVGARVRKSDVDTNPCLVIPRKRSLPVRDENRSETLAEETVQRLSLAADPAGELARPAAEPQEPTDADRGAALERTRVEGILLATRTARLTQDFADGLIRDGVSLVDAQTRDSAIAAPRAPGRRPGPRRSRSSATIRSSTCDRGSRAPCCIVWRLSTSSSTRRRGRTAV